MRILRHPRTDESLPGVEDSYKEEHGGITAEMFAIGGTKNCYQFVVLQRGTYNSLNCYFVAKAWKQDVQIRYSDTACHTAYDNHNAFLERMSTLYTAYSNEKERKQEERGKIWKRGNISRYGIP